MKALIHRGKENIRRVCSVSMYVYLSNSHTSLLQAPAVRYGKMNDEQ